MPNRLRKRPGADADLDSIWSYIASDNLDAAERLMARIRAAFALLVQIRGLAATARNLRRGLRSFVVANYVVFYFALADGIEVVRVMHGRRDIDADDMT